MLTWSGTPCAAHDNLLIWLEPGSGGSFPAPPGPFPPQKARRWAKKKNRGGDKLGLPPAFLLCGLIE